MSLNRDFNLVDRAMQFFNYWGPVPERPITANPGLKILFHFLYLPSYESLRVTFCVIIIISQSKGSTVCSKLELHVLRMCLKFGLILG